MIIEGSEGRETMSHILRFCTFRYFFAKYEFTSHKCKLHFVILYCFLFTNDGFSLLFNMKMNVKSELNNDN